MTLQAQLYMIKGMIADIDPFKQAEVDRARRAFNKAITEIKVKHGEAADIAFGITMLEYAIEQEKQG